MFAVTTSAALVGSDPRPVEIEAHVGRPKETFALVGLPDASVREAKHRVQAAVASSSFVFPRRRVIVNLAPADLPKVGSAFDLPIALGILAAARQIPPAAARVVAVGELALDGKVRAARGGIAAAMVAAGLGRPCLVPAESAAAARLVPGADVRAVSTLAEAVAAATSDAQAASVPVDAPPAVEWPDLAEVRGQPQARRAAEVAAAGGHHLLMVGPPGSGKSMLAKRIPGLLPPLTPEEQLDVLCVWEAADRPAPLSGRPFRAPHHSASAVSLLGGGSGHPVPGELALAHRGLLFLDELGEFPSHVLDGLRQPLEDGWVEVTRKGYSVRFPAAIQLVAATNPCPCGFRGDRISACRCSEQAVERYRRRLSGPLLDRFDLKVWVGRPERLDGPPGEASAEVAARVAAARQAQAGRQMLNAHLSGEALDELPVGSEASETLSGAVAGGRLTGRGYDRVRRVARTIADLASRREVEVADVAEALAYRAVW
jgi:magnesium chelatase family protein